MYKKTKKTIRIELTNDDDLANYDEIINNPLCKVLREIKETRTVTEYSGGEDGSTTTMKFPILIVTYEERELT